jgi:hypothetical protein
MSISESEQNDQLDQRAEDFAHRVQCDERPALIKKPSDCGARRGFVAMLTELFGMGAMP